MQDKSFKLILGERSYDVSTMFENYSANNQHALTLFNPKTGEDVLTASVCLVDCNLSSDEIAIKNYSENEGVLQALIDNGIVQPPHRWHPTGWVNIDICRLIA